MDQKKILDIHFKETTTNEFIVVEERTLFNLFGCRKFKSRSGIPFEIKTIKGPHFYYKKFSLDLDDLLYVEFIYPYFDERPFVMCLEKSDHKKTYYSMFGAAGMRWRAINELNGISSEMQDKILLDVLKRTFSKFFEIELMINSSIMKKRIYDLFNIKYTIIPEVFYCDGYDRYHYKTEQAHSVIRIRMNKNYIQLDRSLSFVKEFYFYFTYYDTTTPLMMETFDYKIADSIPLHNYYIPASVEGKRWIELECAKNLIEPKCKSDLKRILDKVKEMYRVKAVTMDIKYENVKDVDEITRIFSNVPFNYQFEIKNYYGIYSYTPIVASSFFIENLVLNNIGQEIDLTSTEFSNINMFYKVGNESQPLLICFKLHNPNALNQTIFHWYHYDIKEKNKWYRLDFNANPYENTDLIEAKMKSLYDNSSKLSSLMQPLRWMSVFMLGAVIGGFIGVRLSGRIRIALLRMYRRLR